MDNIPHIALPIRFLGSQYATVQQDTTDEVAACVAAIVAFPIGYREDDPDFGISDPAFEMRPIDTAEIEEVVEDYEPRAELNVTVAEYDPSDPLATTVHIEVNVATTEDA